MLPVSFQTPVIYFIHTELMKDRLKKAEIIIFFGSEIWRRSLWKSETGMGALTVLFLEFWGETEIQTENAMRAFKGSSPSYLHAKSTVSYFCVTLLS
jgi:hypothetical protein